MAVGGVGLTLGLGVSLWRGLVGFASALEDRSTLDAGEFEQLLVQKTPSGQPAVKDIRAYRMDDGSYWLSAQQFLVARRGGPGVEGYVPVRIRAKTPYVPKTQPPRTVDPHFTVIDYLQSVKARHPELSYSTRWWDREPIRSPIFAVAGMALLAGIAPMLAGARAGAAPRGNRRKEPEYDLSRFGKHPSDATATVPAKPGITGQDLEKLRQLEAELERNLAARPGGTGGEADGGVSGGGGIGGKGADESPASPGSASPGGAAPAGGPTQAP